MPLPELARLVVGSGHRLPGLSPARSALYLGFAAGLRVSELVGLRLNDLELDGPYPSIRVRGKGRQQRRLPLWKEATRALRAWLAVRGDLLYTQEQRGDDEVIACYNVTTGDPVWKHRDPTRFWESNAGALVAYDIASGDPRWLGPAGGPSYSSPHLLTIAGVPQVLLLSEGGATSVAPADGTVLWEHPWPGYPIVQPALIADGDVLISVSAESGTGRLAVAHRPGGWTVDERWTSVRLKPYFNDLVVHDGHAFGFDGRILACIDLDDGQRQWKGGRYGNGQLVLLPDQDVLLVLSERGDPALVGATPDKFTEIARVPAIEGETWNHPVVVGDVLLVRNDQEMAAFRLSLAGG